MDTLKRSQLAQQVHNKTDIKIVCRQLQDSLIVVAVTLICVFVCYLYLIYLCMESPGDMQIVNCNLQIMYICNLQKRKFRLSSRDTMIDNSYPTSADLSS